MITVVLEKDSIGLGSGISHKYSKKWQGSWFIFELSHTGLADGLDTDVSWMWDMKASKDNTAGTLECVRICCLPSHPFS